MKNSILLSVCAILLFAFSGFGCAVGSSQVVTAPDGVEIHFDRQGNDSPALVFVHGWANNRTIWKAQVDHFSENYEVINIDLPSFGESGNNRAHFSIKGFGKDVATVVENLGLSQVVLVGFSLGASVAIEAATEIPDSVIGIVVVEHLHDIAVKTPASAFEDSARPYLDVVTNPTNEKLVAGGFYTRNQNASFQRVVAMLEGGPRDGWKESLFDSMRWQQEDCAESLEQLQVPVLGIYAELRPINVEALQEHVPSFRAMTIPGAGHLVMWDAPQEFNRLLEQSIQELKVESTNPEQ